MGANLAQSRRQIEDVAAILRVRWDALDHTYLEKWITELGLKKSGARRSVRQESRIERLWLHSRAFALCCRRRRPHRPLLGPAPELGNLFGAGG